SPSFSEADSDRVVIGLAISLPLNLVDALDMVEDDCFDVGAYSFTDFINFLLILFSELQRAIDMRLYPSHVVD
ncbi:hypothetical protein Tco_0243637, partial [Tanacetum coccineum]